MSIWIEIPRCRVLQVTAEELDCEYDLLNEAGKLKERGERIYRIVRKKDNRVFKPAPFSPSDSYVLDVFYLEELT